MTPRDDAEEPPGWTVGQHLAFEFAKAAVAAVAAEGIRFCFELWRDRKKDET